MTANEAANYIGRTGLLTIRPFKVPVQVLDVRQAYGHLRFQVTPLHNGDTRPDVLGKEWVNASRVELSV